MSFVAYQTFEVFRLNSIPQVTERLNEIHGLIRMRLGAFRAFFDTKRVLSWLQSDASLEKQRNCWVNISQYFKTYLLGCHLLKKTAPIDLRITVSYSSCN
jgi:hypothetical protein